MNAGNATFIPEAEFILVNLSKSIIVFKENLTEHCVILELFTFGCRTKTEI